MVEVEVTELLILQGLGIIGVASIILQITKVVTHFWQKKYLIQNQ
jgi:hypothetical protein